MVRGDINSFITVLGLLEKSNSEKADLIAELMIELNPDNHDALLIAARHESDNSRFENGLAVAEAILEADPTHIPASVEKARANYYLGHRDLAFRAFEKIVKENMSDPDGNYYFSKLLAEEQIEPRRSGNFARRAFFHSDRSVKYVLNLCFVYFRAERFDLCRGEAKKALRRFSKEPELAYWLGMAQYMDSKPKARATLDKAIELGLDGEYLTKAKEVLAKL
jgi:tetratricopeptide (TPR) repeat protein